MAAITCSAPSGSKARPDSSQDAKVAALEAAGHPVVHFEISDLCEMFGLFFT